MTITLSHCEVRAVAIVTFLLDFLFKFNDLHLYLTMLDYRMIGGCFLINTFTRICWHESCRHFYYWWCWHHKCVKCKRVYQLNDILTNNLGGSQHFIFVQMERVKYQNIANMIKYCNYFANIGYIEWNNENKILTCWNLKLSEQNIDFVLNIHLLGCTRYSIMCHTFASVQAMRLEKSWPASPQHPLPPYTNHIVFGFKVIFIIEASGSFFQYPITTPVTVY